MTHDTTGELPPDGPQTFAEALGAIEERDVLIAGHESTLRSQSRTIGKLEREVKRYAEADAVHPQHKKILALIERWKRTAGHPNAKASKDRFDVIKARLKDGYTLDQLELAIDGVGAYPFVVNGQRVRTGNPSQRHDSLSLALKGGENVERFANLGARARAEGWQP